MVWDSRRDNDDTQRIKNQLFCGLYVTNRTRDRVLLLWPLVVAVLVTLVIHYR